MLLQPPSKAAANSCVRSCLLANANMGLGSWWWDDNPAIDLSYDLGKTINTAVTSAASKWFGDKASVVGQTIGVTAPPKLNTSNVPVFQPPAAPQTPDAMVQWTPAWLKDVNAQVQKQFDRDAAMIRANASDGTSAPDPAGSGNDPKEAANVGMLLLVGFGVLAVGMVVIAASKK